MTEPLRIAVIGATGATGRHVVTQAQSRGHHVRAVDTAFPDETALPRDVERVEADVLGDDLGPALDGYDVVVSAIGIALSARNAIAPPPLYRDGTRRILHAMRSNGQTRLVVISASFVAARNRGPHWFRIASGLALGRIFAQMAEMEALLRGSTEIDWTAVRPGWLMDGTLTTDYVVTPEAIRPDLIRTRHADLAHFILHCAETGEWSRDTPAIARPEPRSASSLDTALRDAVAG
ncbi:NAD(P)H-binding protein [Palleronia sp. LCG004]|uniref:NAD(P)H-binding protein n=1 Tax=Palleronia sp. LCG004 TaxID=3079304 RepID=UPI002942D0A6|nr:NAD(P)H-binding protein [Palleronia sp. LCG004]WOI56611.1 NAD(P)H-binding protein [Palleronia sp. LCG004]